MSSVGDSMALVLQHCSNAQMLSKLLFSSQIGLGEETQSMTTIYNSVTSSVFKKVCMWTMQIPDLLNYYYYYYYYC